MRWVLLFVVLSACSGRAWNTTVADTAIVRASMLDSVVIGQTTDTAFVTRWGKPTQIVQEGAQEAWIYRNIANPPGAYLLNYGTSSRYVIVDFQYGIATGIRASDDVGCRGTFPPRPPSYGFDNPTTVRPVNCVARTTVLLPAVPVSAGAHGPAGGWK